MLFKFSMCYRVNFLFSEMICWFGVIIEFIYFDCLESDFNLQCLVGFFLWVFYV